MRLPLIKTGPLGIPLTAKAALFEAHRQRWSMKEASYLTGWSHKHLHWLAAKLKVGVPYLGRGRRSKHRPYGPDAT